jgi:hypothetical protein
MPPVTYSYWVLAIVAFAVCGVFSLAIAAWLMRELTRAALEKSAQEDIPQVLTALSGLLDKLSLLLPWSRRGRESLPSGVPTDGTTGHTGSVKDLSQGGPQ